MNKKTRDKLASEHGDRVGHSEASILSSAASFRIGFNKGYAMAEKRAEGLVEAIKYHIKCRDGYLAQDLACLDKALAKYNEDGE